MLYHYHDGVADFPHGAGASEVGWYVYRSFEDQEPSGPYRTIAEAITAAFVASVDD